MTWSGQLFPASAKQRSDIEPTIVGNGSFRDVRLFFATRLHTVVLSFD
jgi:hypothetical protein